MSRFTQTIPVSAFLICFNEERTIETCLRRLAEFAEIVVVDSGSTDRTLEIIKSLKNEGLPIRVFHNPWAGYGAQKQFALEQCGQAWALNVDADEFVEPELASEIAKSVGDPGDLAGYNIDRRQWVPGYGFAHPWVKHDHIVRLIRVDRASYDPAQTVHESVVANGVIGEVRRGFLLHAQEIPVEREVEKQNLYTSLKVEARNRQGKRSRAWLMLTSPVAYFVKFYVFKRYLLCGWGGLAFSLMAANYGFQAEYKHWRSQIELKLDDEVTVKR